MQAMPELTIDDPAQLVANGNWTKISRNVKCFVGSRIKKEK